MIYLWIVSIIWAFSFGLIKENFNGIDPNLIASVRLLISLLVFLPFLRIKKIERRLFLPLIITGIFQYGLMYIFYFHAFHYLQSYEVALFTIFTPLYITLIHDVMRKKFHTFNLFTTLLAIAGTAVVKQAGLVDGDIFIGFIFVQLSNICFAFGQLYYREILRDSEHVKEENIFAILYLGGFLASFVPVIGLGSWRNAVFSSSQLLALLYLGAVASGFCFFLWNYGARRVDAGALAIFNNLKVPLAIAVSLLFFHETTNLLSLFLGGIIILFALLLNEWHVRRMKKQE